MSSVTHMKTRSYKRSQHTTLPGQARPDLDFYLFFLFVYLFAYLLLSYVIVYLDASSHRVCLTFRSVG